MAERHDVVSDPFTQSFIKIKAAQLCRRRDFSRSDRSDLQQGMLAYLVEKQHLFDPARGNVEAFVTQLVNTWIRIELRFRGRRKRLGNLIAISLERTFIEVDGDKESLDHIIAAADLDRRTGADVRDPIESLEVGEAVRHAFGRLKPGEKALLLFVAEHGVAGAAREWTRRAGRTVSRRQIENRLDRMRSRFEDAGLGTD